MNGAAPERPSHWHVVLETERLVLRRFTLDDAEALVALDADPRVRRYVNTGPAPDLAFYRDHKLPEWIAWYEKGPWGYWAAHEKPGLDFVGWFHLRPDPADAEAQELGYRFAPRAWGRGLATEGSRALIERARRDLGVRCITAHCLLGNEASMRVMEKCGMRRLLEFTVDERRLPGASEEERRAVGYVLEFDPPR